MKLLVALFDTTSLTNFHSNDCQIAYGDIIANQICFGGFEIDRSSTLIIQYPVCHANKTLLLSF